MSTVEIRTLLASACLLVGFFTQPPAANAVETVSGKINGLHCITEERWRPVDKLDPHLVLEPDFVLQTADGNYFFLPNMRRETKMRYVLERVQVIGTLNKKYKAIEVDEIRVKKGDAYQTVWSPEMERKEWNIWYRQAE